MIPSTPYRIPTRRPAGLPKSVLAVLAGSISLVIACEGSQTGGSNDPDASPGQEEEGGIDLSVSSGDSTATPTESGTDGESGANSNPETESEAGDATPGDESEETAADDTGDDETDWDVETPKFDLLDFEGILIPKDCPLIQATSRDFKVSHRDFEFFAGEKPLKGIVENQLGGDGKPVHRTQGATSQTNGRMFFEQWYNDVPGTNMAFDIEIVLEKTPEGICTYDNPAFFPLDGRGFGNEGQMDDMGNSHNFHFTTEIHTEFVYQRGQHFTFTGDDDLWMFVDGKLVIDLGGLHPPASATVEMDDLGLTEGATYPMDIFHAERHTFWSNFRIDTNIQLFPPG